MCSIYLLSLTIIRLISPFVIGIPVLAPPFRLRHVSLPFFGGPQHRALLDPKRGVSILLRAVRATALGWQGRKGGSSIR